MSIDPISAPQRLSQPTPAAAGRAPQDAKQLADEFSAAARRGQLPLGGRGQLGKDGKPLRTMTGKPLAPPETARAGAAAALPTDDKRRTTMLQDTNRDQAAMALTDQTAMPGFVAPTAAPQAAAHVDPGAFADMLTHIWLREQGKTAREVRVSFGDAAWPATGATLLRLDDGSLRVTVAFGQRGHDTEGGLIALQERLKARGLNVSDIAVEDDRG